MNSKPSTSKAMWSEHGCLPLLTAQAAVGNDRVALLLFPAEPLSVQAGWIWPKCRHFNGLRSLKKERIVDSSCKLWRGFFAELRGEFI